MKYTCPVCMFPSLPYPPADYHICPCCSTEFGNDDSVFSHQQLRKMWTETGAHWFFGNPPAHWNPWKQLIDAGYGAATPWFSGKLLVQVYTTIAPVPTVSHVPDKILAEIAA